MALSLRMLGAQFARETGETPVLLVTIDSTEMVSPINICNNGEDVESDSVIYTAWPFDISLPSEVPGKKSRTTIKISNVSQQVESILDVLVESPEVTISLVLASTPDTIERGPSQFILDSYVADKFDASGSLSYGDDIHEPVSKHSFTPQEFPGDF